MQSFLKAQWRDFLDSFDPDMAGTVSFPSVTLLTLVAMLVVFLTLGYVPPLARLSGFEHAWVSAVLACIGAVFTFTAFRRGCRGTLGSLATVLDMTFYSGAFAFAATHSKGGAAIALAVVHSGALLAIPAQVYGFSTLFALLMTIPVVTSLLLSRPAFPVAIIMVCGLILLLLFTYVTRYRRNLMRRGQRLEQALGAAHDLADESMQAALASTLLSLGHFLHELRNYQTVIASNLEYVQSTADLDEESRGALEDAQQAQLEQARLVRSTIDDLKRRSMPDKIGFSLVNLVREVASDRTSSVGVSVADSERDLEVRGNPEHFRVVLLNLLRNAEQAGAGHVEVELHFDPGGDSVTLVFADDGPGIPVAQRERLFDSFTFSTKAHGSGFGLYLVRRYVELLGGKVRVENSSLGGAAFHIQIPGSVVPPRLQEDTH